MGRSEPYAVMWTPRTTRQLAALLLTACHGEQNPEWRKRKAGECRDEARRRLEWFPNLRDRYVIDGLLCNAITLRSFPTQLLYREVEAGKIIIFLCRWARQDETGPRDPRED